MCGLVGFLQPGGFAGLNAIALTRQLSERLSHRGPDGCDEWVDSAAGIALGHRRLAVLDLSESGRQPMVSRCGRYVLSLNGEIYNHLEFRADLNKSGIDTAWRGHSDTESVLESISAWGIERVLKKSVGMFAFAIWDRQNRILTLARDRMGEKPLYYGWSNGVFLFASELKAIRAHPSFVADIDRRSLARYFRFGYIPAPHSIYSGISKLLPGSYLQIDPARMRKSVNEPVKYWSIEQIVQCGRLATPAVDEQAYIEEFESLLNDAIALQRIADVPVGAFLSGGIDSSTIVAMMQNQSLPSVKTFTIGLDDRAYDEAPHAKELARHLGTDHTEMYLSPEDVMAIIPGLGSIYDEPFGDSSAIPTCLVARLARQSVTVSLSGDGGDELFGGYDRYARSIQSWNRFRNIPVAARRAVAGVLRTAVQWVPRHSLAWNMERLGDYLGAGEFSDFYQVQISKELSSTNLVHGQVGSAELYSPIPYLPDELDAMMCMDSMTYLPDDILVKVDRASMAVSLESRIPLLDHRIVEFAWKLPLSMKVREGQSKWLLRKVLEKYVPRSVLERPKQGFSVPIADWLRGPLREWAESLLNTASVENEEIINSGVVNRLWSQHIRGSNRCTESIWQVLMYVEWSRNARLLSADLPDV